MRTIEELFKISPYSLAVEEKTAFLLDYLNQLVRHHQAGCPEYARILAAADLAGRTFQSLEEFPFLPVRLFKQYALKSIPDDQVLKSLRSSGTTSQAVSRIYIDKATSMYQVRCLSAIVQSFIGNQRLPMIIVDSERAISDRRLLSARGAGILGFSSFGRDHIYALDERMEVKEQALKSFLESHAGQTILLFGFTYVVWDHFLEPLRRANTGLDFRNAILIHGGGWKKLHDRNIGNEAFKQALKAGLGIQRVHNYYGLIEQTGSIFMECEFGRLHASNFSDVLIRNPQDWSVMQSSGTGIIELLSALPHSYPGHCILTDDLGRVLSEDNCACGRKGKYFEVSGRVPQADLRGCSDTYEYRRTEQP